MAILTVEHLTCSYPGASEPALRDVSLSVEEGESLGIIGPNGAGKSTLFHCIVGLRAFSRGGIRAAGFSPTNPGEIRPLRRAVGVVFQSTEDQVFHPTVIEDVAFGPLNHGEPRDTALEQARKSLLSVGVPERMFHSTPHSLSNGQRRRVALAGVIACSPRILLLDEPGSDLDPRGRHQLLALLAELRITMCIASHDLEFIRASCARVLLLDGGAAIREGGTDEILGDHALMEDRGLEVPRSLR